VEPGQVRVQLLDELGDDAAPDVLEALGRLTLPPEQHDFCLPASAVLEKSRADPSRRTFAVLLADRDAVDAVEIVGIGVLQADGGGAEVWPSQESHVVLRGFSVDSRFQGRGVGAAATAAAVDLAQRAFPSASHLVLTVHVDNVAGQRVYERSGFEPTGRTVVGRAGEEHVMARPLRRET
jgi:RimJ/RimL family protein N-acetyltransferase